MSSSVSFVVGFPPPSEDKSAQEKYHSREALGSVLVRVPCEDHLLVLTNAMDRIGERKDGGVPTARC